MIKSIKILDTDQGYVSERIKKPCFPKGDNPTPLELRDFDEKMEYYNSHQEEFNNPNLASSLLREIKFSDVKINILYGPNGCGKTTLLDVIAANVGSYSGGTLKFLEPKYFDKLTEEELKTAILKSAQNISCEIDWDGVPVYYENFKENNLRNPISTATLSYATTDENLFITLKDKVAWMNYVHKHSSGERSKFIYYKLLQKLIALKNSKVSSLLRVSDSPLQSSTWFERVKKFQLDYWSKYPQANSGKPITLLLDDPELSLDLLQQYKFYLDTLPSLQKKFKGIQIIVATGSPVVISDRLSDKYNIIPLVPGYIEECKHVLGTFWK